MVEESGKLWTGHQWHQNGCVLSTAVSNEHTGGRVLEVPGQQLVWSVVSAASLVEGA